MELAPTSDCNKNDKPIGNATPVIAIRTENTILAFKEAKVVERPPSCNRQYL
jgi:hypothetical protein